MSEQNQRINSRLNKNNRKKKTNTILNILIGFVLLLIIVVVVNLVTDDKGETDKAQEREPKETASLTETDEPEAESEEPEDLDLTTEEVEEGEQNESATEENDSATEPITSPDSSNEIIEESEDPNVEAVVVNPSWEPIGTSQVGEHVSVYDSESIDWAEKVSALAYAANLEPSNMIVKFLGNGGSPQKSIGTVTSKDGKEIYRISLEWVDGQGWKPTKKEKLSSLK